MPFIGQQPTTGAFLELDSLTASATADYTLQLNGANYQPESVNNLLVSINGVIQGSNTMSLSGSTLTVGATLSSSDVIDFVRVFGNVGTISTPTDGSVTANKIGTGAVDLTTKVTGVLPYANGGNQTVSISAYKWNAVDQNSSNTTIPSSSIMVNVGSDLASSGVYTCPVDGVYRATIWGMAGGDGANSQSSIFSCYLSLNGSFPSDNQYHIYVNPASTYANFSANFLITCSATNTLNWGIQANRRTLHEAHGQATFKLEHQT